MGPWDIPWVVINESVGLRFFSGVNCVVELSSRRVTKISNEQSHHSLSHTLSWLKHVLKKYFSTLTTYDPILAEFPDLILAWPGGLLQQTRGKLPSSLAMKLLKIVHLCPLRIWTLMWHDRKSYKMRQNPWKRIIQNNLTFLDVFVSFLGVLGAHCMPSGFEQPTAGDLPIALASRFTHPMQQSPIPEKSLESLFVGSRTSGMFHVTIVCSTYKNSCVFYIFTTFSMKNYSWFISKIRLVCQPTCTQSPTPTSTHMRRGAVLYSEFLLRSTPRSLRSKTLMTVHYYWLV